jgi:nucleoside-diphosphate-sugar epimerase
MAEVAALAASSDAMPIVAIRPHLVWGPGDTQLVGRIVERARQGRLALVGSGTALIDTTYLDNAADALVAALDRAPRLGGQAFVVSNGEPRTVAELVARIVGAAGLDRTPRRVPVAIAKAGGSVVERIWDRTGRTDDPPMTSFLAEQLSTAHWFDQRATRAALGWCPTVSLDDGFERLAAWFRDGAVSPPRSG